MTGQDIDKLFELLAVFRPGDKHLLDQTLRNAWLLILKPYTPDDVRKAVAEYFRHSKYWPDVTDIARLCPEILQTGACTRPEEGGWRWQEQREMIDRHAVLKRRRSDAGIPATWEEAQDGGLTAADYVAACDAAGLGLEMSL